MNKKSRRLNLNLNLNKKRHKKYRGMRKTHKKRHKKYRQIVSIPGSKGMPLFSHPKHNSLQKILVNQKQQQEGNMIPGLRQHI